MMRRGAAEYGEVDVNGGIPMLTFTSCTTVAASRAMTALILGLLLVCSAAPLMATNGDELIGVGPNSRAMGGVGIAATEDVITAVFCNPATLTTLEGDSYLFAGSVLKPTVRARVESPAPPYGVGSWSGKSRDKAYPIPTMGFRIPCRQGNLCFALGAYGITGMGVDYRNQDPMNVNTNISVMQFAPAVAWKRGKFSLGAALNIDYQSADLGAGESHNYGFGARLGALYQLEAVALGLTYTTPQPMTHERLYDFDMDGWFDDLELGLPQKVGAGVAWTGSEAFLVEADVRWIDWANARGYEDFDWESQWTFAVGGRFHATERLSLRAGYNYGKNVVAEHNGWNPGGMTSFQGYQMSTFAYEYFRIIGFPAIVEHHITMGLGWQLTDNFIFNLGYVRGLENTITETSAGGMVELESTLSEDFLEFGFGWSF